MKRTTLITLVCLVAVCEAMAQQVRGIALMDSLHNIVQPIRVLGYGGGNNRTWAGFGRTDRMEGGQVRDRYSSAVRYLNDDNTAVSGMNIEHIWANSWWGHLENNAYKDLYNLYPSDAAANQRKSNNPIGVVDGTVAYDNGTIRVGKTQSCPEGQVTVWEPADEWKGDFARTYFYMATCYKHFGQEGLWTTAEGLLTVDPESPLVMRPWVSTLMLEWAEQDPVDDIERERCDSIEWIQGNRNPYVDFPSLCHYVWGDSTDCDFDLQRIRDRKNPDIHIEPDPDPSTTVKFSVSPETMFFVAHAGEASRSAAASVFMQNTDQPTCTATGSDLFEVSLDGEQWQQTITTAYATQGFYVRFAGASEPGTYEGEIICAAPGAEDRIITVTGVVSDVAFWENFETGSKSAYAKAEISCNAATWEMSNAMLASDKEKDRPRDQHCVRMKGYVKTGTEITTPAHIMMTTDKANGCDSLSLWASSYGTDTGVKIRISYSLDGGLTWLTAVDELPLTATPTRYAYHLGIEGNVRLKIESLNTGSKRACIDDIQMTDRRPATAIHGVTHSSPDSPAYTIDGKRATRCSKMVVKGGKKVVTS